MYVRRALFVVALALAASAAPARAAQPVSGGASHWAVLLGMEDLGDSGIELRGDMVLPQRPLSPQVGFSIVPSLGFSRFSNDYTDAFYGFYGASVDESLNIFRGTVSARFEFGRSPQWKPYVDAGLGLYLASYSYEFRDLGTNQVTSNSQSEFGLVMRFAGGIAFQVSPTFALGAELGFMPYIGDGPDDTSTNLLFSATFRM